MELPTTEHDQASCWIDRVLWDRALFRKPDFLLSSSDDDDADLLAASGLDFVRLNEFFLQQRLQH